MWDTELLCSFPGGQTIRNVGGWGVGGQLGKTEIRTKKELPQAPEPVTGKIRSICFLRGFLLILLQMMNGSAIFIEYGN